MGRRGHSGRGRSGRRGQKETRTSEGSEGKENEGRYMNRRTRGSRARGLNRLQPNPPHDIGSARILRIRRRSHPPYLALSAVSQVPHMIGRFMKPSTDSPEFSRTGDVCANPRAYVDGQGTFTRCHDGLASGKVLDLWIFDWYNY